MCDSLSVVDPCEFAKCGKGTCDVVDHRAICACNAGYRLSNDRCEDVNECLEQRPCHASALCQNMPGAHLCVCPEGLLGDPAVGCRAPGECIMEADCPTNAICRNGHCHNPCEDNVCGENAVCTTVDHTITCDCAPHSRGDPFTKCTKMECEDKNECSRSKTCVDFKCVDPCTVGNVCGTNAECSTVNHVGVCSCPTGTTGNPQLGCVPIEYCNADKQCTGGSRCEGGVCAAVCTTGRDCLGDQLCIEAVCKPTCKSNTTCPDFQFCLNNICSQEVKCQSDADCDTDESCITDANGRTECRNSCDGRVLCGRNADCRARNHVAECSCKDGFYEDSKGVCRKIECKSNSDCNKDKFCEGHMCKIACLVGKPCGENTICSSANHVAACECQPGFSGNPKTGCTAIDFCLANPCGNGAKCRNSRGSYRCSCPTGTVGDAYKDGCRQPVECVADGDCPINAKCSTVKGVPKCKDVCEGRSCGINAECMSENHKAKCVCRAGFTGDAATKCEPIPVPCERTADCLQNTYCHDKICKCKYDAEISHYNPLV